MGRKLKAQFSDGRGMKADADDLARNTVIQATSAPIMLMLAPGNDADLLTAYEDLSMNIADIAANLTGSVNNWDPAGLSALTINDIALITVTTDGAYNITRIVPPAGGCRVIFLTGTSATSITLTNEDASSEPANRLIAGLIFNSQNTQGFIYSTTRLRWLHF